MLSSAVYPNHMFNQIVVFSYSSISFFNWTIYPKQCQTFILVSLCASSVAMARSRSTPGLVESTGKTPLDAMIIQRHHTLPVGLIHKDGSGGERAAPSRDDTMAVLSNTQSEDNLISRCVTEQNRRLSTDSQQQVGNMTISMTISSMTSYCGTPPQKSPICTEIGRNPFSTPPSPKVTAYQKSNSTTVVNSAPLVNGHSSLGHPTPHHAPPSISPAAAQYAYQNLTYINPGQPINFLSPFCPPHTNYPASPSHFPGSPPTYHHPPTPSLLLPQIPPSPTPHISDGIHPHLTQTPLLSFSPSPAMLHHPPHIITSANSQMQHPQAATFASISPLHSSLSPMLHRDNSQSEMLLKEITRLRERLAQLEGENSALTVKLNRQQWDVESRLTELEMHICQSDSVASTEFDGDSLRQDSKSTPPIVNRESIIWLFIHTILILHIYHILKLFSCQQCSIHKYAHRSRFTCHVLT